MTDERNPAAEEQGIMSPDEVQALLDERMAAANERLIAAEVREIGLRVGLIDPDAALALMNRDGIAVDETGRVTGVKEALDELLAAKPYLAGRGRFGTGGRGNFPRNGGDGDGFAARLAAARSRGDHCLATAIIAEAARKGVMVR